MKFKGNLFNNPDKIVDLFDKLYSQIIDRNTFLSKIKLYSFQRFFIRLIVNVIIPLYFDLTKNNKDARLLNKNSHSPKLIVSLTTFPARVQRVWIVIESLLRQSHKPDRMILWLSQEQFFSIDNVPQKLVKLQERGLEIRFCEGDIKSHKKYYYTLQEFPDDIMITFDDDIFYPTTTIEEIIESHRIFPEAIIARYGLKIKVLENEIAPYKSWSEYYQQKSPDFKILFGSGGGTLFPPHSLPSETLNKDIFMELCFYADDIWLNTMCRLNNKKIFRTKTKLCSILPIINKNNISLSSKNYHECFNDKQLRNVRDYFILNRGVDPYFEILNV